MLTINEAEAMTLPQRFAAFCADRDNMSTQIDGSLGLTVAKQAALHNNWQKALGDWMRGLPRRRRKH